MKPETNTFQKFRIARRLPGNFIIRLLGLMLALSPVAEAQAQFTFVTNDNALTLTAYSGPGGEVAIPDHINGYPVTSIGQAAFWKSAGLTSVLIPDTITNIGGSAFYLCTNLAGLMIPSSVVGIEGGAFVRCESLTNVVIPDAVVYLGTGAFNGCTSLSNVSLGSNISRIENGTFGMCTSLRTISFPESVKSIGQMSFQSCSNLGEISFGNGIGFIDERAFQYCTSLTNLVLPNSLTNMGTWVFGNCGNLLNVKVGSGLRWIPDGSFIECQGLTNVVIPASVTNLDFDAFAGCVSLRSVFFMGDAPSVNQNVFLGDTNATAFYVRGTAGWGPTLAGIPTWPPDFGVGFIYTTNAGAILITGYTNGGTAVVPETIHGLPVTAIDDSAFADCYGLQDVTIPGSVTRIGANAFSDCSLLTNVSIPGSVTNIGYHAFYNCHNLCQVVIPEGVLSIGDEAFFNCWNLTNVSLSSTVTNLGVEVFTESYRLSAFTVDPFNPAFCSVDGVLFTRDKTTLIQYPGARGGSYTVPDGVMKISEFAFYYSGFLTNVVVPKSVIEIGESAFGDCYDLRSVDFWGDAPLPPQGPYPHWFADGGLATVYFLPGRRGWDYYFPDVGSAPWLLPYPIILNDHPSFGVQTNGFGFLVSWATNVSVVVEACTNLSSPTWSGVATNELSDGTNYFSDPDWTGYSARFYRVRPF